MALARLTALLLGVCLADGAAAGEKPGFGADPDRDPDPDPEWQAKADRMVRTQLEARGIADARVLEAMRQVPRHRFISPSLIGSAWDDGALPIGHRQTISQPFVVARMTELLEVGPDDVVLEIGTGSAYQAAVLARLAKHVHTIEIVPELAAEARARLEALGYVNVDVVTGDGYLGLPAHAPFPRILVTAAPDHVPQPLLDQLAVGGRMVIPVGSFEQVIRVIERTESGLEETDDLPVRFVPLVRDHGDD